MEVNFDNLLTTGAHFGHLTRRWHPNFKPYILMEKNGIHIINLEETIKGLDKSLNFLSDIIIDGGEILFVGTKKNAKENKKGNKKEKTLNKNLLGRKL